MKELRTNIFITADERKKLEGIKYKYHLSFSTIVRILNNHYQAINKNGIDLEEKQLIKGGRKTSIKVKDNKTFIYYSNLVHLFCGTWLKEYWISKLGQEKGIKHYAEINNKIYNEFANTCDQYYDYNSYIRYATAYEKLKARKEAQ